MRLLVEDDVSEPSDDIVSVARNRERPRCQLSSDLVEKSLHVTCAYGAVTVE